MIGLGAFLAAASTLLLGAALLGLAAPRPSPIAHPAHPDAAALRDLGLSLTLRRWEALRVGFAVAAGLAAAAAGVPSAAGALAGALAPSLWLHMRAGEARRRARRSTTHLMRSAHAALRSGAPLAEALRRATAATDDRLAARPFDEALREFAMGSALDRALLGAADRARDGRVREAIETMALGIAERLPVDRVAALVGAVSDRLLHAERLDDEVRARSSGTATQVWLLAFLVPALAGYLLLTVPGLVSTLGGPLGRTVLVPGAIVLEVAGIVLSRRIVNGALR